MYKRGIHSHFSVWRASLLSVVAVLAFLFTTEVVSAAPVAPTNAVTSSVTVNSVRLDWTPGAADSSLLYGVEQSVNGGSYARISTFATGTTFYIFTGLATDTLYGFRVNAGDSSASSSYATATTTYTLATAGGTPTASVVSTTSLQIVLNTATNPTNTFYAIFNTTTGQYLTSAGTATSTPTFFTSSTWNNGSATGLSTNAPYQFVVIARNGGGVNAATSSASSLLYTLANAAGGVTSTVSGTSTLAIQFSSNNNSTSTTYAIYNATAGSYLNSAGAATSTAVFQATSTWGSSVTALGLSANTSYLFSVIARNGNSINAATTSASSVFTYASVPTGVTSSTQDTSSITLAWSGDASQYSAVNITTGVTLDFASGTTAVFTGLGCNASYYFQVQGRNGNGVTTEFATSSLLFTSACASGGAGTTVGIGGSVVSSGGSSGGGNSSSVAPISNIPPAASVPLFVSQSFPPQASLPFVAALSSPTQTTSKVAFSGLPKEGAKQKIGTSFDFRYTVANTSGVQRQVRIERSLVDASGGVINKTSVLVNQRKGQVFTALPKIALPRSLKPGDYEVRIRVVSTKGAVLDTSSFSFTAKK